MSGALGMVLMIASPFIAGGAMLGLLKAIEHFNKRRYERKVEKRNALQELYGIKPFRGTKEWMR
jgi:hypothetical protein